MRLSRYWQRRSVARLESSVGQIVANHETALKRRVHTLDRLRLHLDGTMVVELDNKRTWTDLTESEARYITLAACGLCGKRQCTCDEDYERHCARDMMDFGRENKLTDKE